jgi:succinate dehydrogenase / fumarate reductase cytochrome b subunit
MASTDLKARRPLSPHLSIYRWPLTMAMSIAHRLTGGALYFGTVLLVIWLAALASGPEAFRLVNRIYGSWFGLIVLVGYSWALIHHLLGGLRHFTWDFGIGFDKPARDQLALANIVGSLLLTILLWGIILVTR